MNEKEFVSFVNSCIYKGAYSFCITFKFGQHFQNIKLGGVSQVNKSLTTIRRFGNLKQHSPCLQISDFETSEVNVVDVVFRFAKIV